MASKRMFSLDIVDTDKFLEMPVTTQALYFHLGMRADDDGFISSPKKILKVIGCKEDDLRVLISRGYIIPFESGVVVIRDWRVNNYLRKDRYTETRFQTEKSMLELINDSYEIGKATIGIPDCNQVVDKRCTQDRLGKDSIVKDSKKNICPEPENPAPDPSGILLPLVDKSTYDVPLSKIEKWVVAYPAVNVNRELHKMSAWLDSNPQRRKTRKGIDRFINNWLSREQDKGGTFKAGGRQQETQKEDYSKAEWEKPSYYQYLGHSEPSPDDPFQ